MSAISKSVAPLLNKGEEARRIWKAVKSNAASIIVAAAKGGAKHWLKKAIGEGAEAVIELGGPESLSEVDHELEGQSGRVLDAAADALLEKFSETQNSIANFKKYVGRFLRAVAAQKRAKLPLFVLIDELDRCRPTYAITLLERVKHLFDIDNAVFGLHPVWMTPT